ncbi:DUF2993 domain-containing protein [Agromyces mediolanus]|uniref:LmeA family phospholipid-binding protein n=1 Tax=Agromyces mediolanus TaxID=41986 RepID=UPI003839B481
MSEAATVPIEPTPGAPAPKPKSKRRGLRALVIVLVVVVVLGVAAVVADGIARGIAQQQVAAKIQERLPESVQGDVDVRIGGFSVIAQYLSGRMDEVELTAPALEVRGAPVAVDLTLHGVPVDLEQPVGRLSAKVSIDEDALNTLIAESGAAAPVGAVELGDGTVGYAGQAEVLGFTVDYTASARPEAAGDEVLLTPVDVTVGALGGSIDVSGIVERLLGEDPVAVCVAQYLPEGLRVERVDVAPGTATAWLGAERFVLDGASLSTTGSCD